jgi:hypothetical protein
MIPAMEFKNENEFKTEWKHLRTFRHMIAL